MGCRNGRERCVWREKENDFFNIIFLPWVLKNHIIKQVISLRFPLDREMGVRGMEGLPISHPN